MIAATHTRFRIDSDTRPGVEYTVDVEANTCTCPARKACKHLATARRFRELEVELEILRHSVTPLVQRPVVRPSEREMAPLVGSTNRGRRGLYGDAA
jgi:hypothetical protein